MLKFTSLTIENFGPFKGSQTIDFTDENGVTIIWGNNGRGKTTLLNIFRYALFGHYRNRRGTEVDLPTLSNIEGRAEGNYDFKVVLKMLNDDVPYELTRQCKVRKGVVVPVSNDDYETYVFLKEKGSILSPEQKDHMLRVIMPDEVSRFFLFDGELLQEYEELLVEGTEVGAKIKDSIEQILGVPVLTNSATDAQSVAKDFKKEKNKIAQSNSKTKKIASQIESIEAENRVQQSELKRLKNELEEQLDLKSKLQDDQQQSEHVKKLLDQMDSLEAEIETNNIKCGEILSQIVIQTKDAWKGMVSIRVDSLIKQIDSQLNVLEDKEKSLAVDDHIVKDMQEVVRTHHCKLCDQDVNNDHIEKLQARIIEYQKRLNGLNGDEKNTLDDLRIRKAALESMRSSSNSDALKIYEDQLSELKVEIDDKKRQYKEVREELDRHGDIDKLQKDSSKLIKDLAQCLSKIDNLKDGIKATKQKIMENESALASLEEKQDRATTDSDLKLAGKKVQICENIQNIFEEGIASYRDKLKEDVERDATNLFVSISSDPGYKKLQINENYGLSMVHKTGQIVPLRSSGFEHIVALCLIGALHKNAPLRGPIIMDSPFGRLDPIHKKNIIKILPELSDQVVLLVYTREVDEQLTRESLGNALKKEYRLTYRSSFHTEIELQ